MRSFSFTAPEVSVAWLINRSTEVLDELSNENLNSLDLSRFLVDLRASLNKLGPDQIKIKPHELYELMRSAQFVCCDDKTRFQALAYLFSDLLNHFFTKEHRAFGTKTKEFCEFGTAAARQDH